MIRLHPASSLSAAQSPRCKARLFESVLFTNETIKTVLIALTSCWVVVMLFNQLLLTPVEVSFVVFLDDETQQFYQKNFVPFLSLPSSTMLFKIVSPLLPNGQHVPLLRLRCERPL